MEYIIFDLEFNQGFDKKLNKTVSNEKCPFEIIQIGAIKLDSKFNIIDTFNSYVKPTIYKDIHPFISRMTNIKNSDFNDSPTFPEVYNNFIKFISSQDPILCVWGAGDLKELYRNINYHKLPSNSYLNLILIYNNMHLNISIIQQEKALAYKMLFLYWNLMKKCLITML